MPFRIIKKDITTLTVDALVNSTNSDMYGYAGVDKLIHELGGEEFDRDCAELKGKLRFGEALYTKAYGALKCKYVIHTYGPTYINGLEGEPVILRSCYRESLRLAASLGCRTVAFPLICAGTLAYPIEEALGIAISAINEYLNLENGKLDVTLAIYFGSSDRVSESLLKDLDRYIADNFFSSKAPEEEKKSLDQVLAGKKEKFHEMLRRLMDERGLSDPEVYHPLYMSPKTFNKIINGNVKQPKKNTIYAIAITMKLSYEETKALMESAGLTFSSSNRQDIIIAYCLQNGIRSLYDINMQLVGHEEEPVCC
ncbi:MAG: macro domain-containing protein [Firmicutes bacterium]|nr:macro domain-containing protein [Bacillota bacterium]